VLDIETEKRRISFIMPLLRKRTTIVVSHSMSLLERADAVYELRTGRLWPVSKENTNLNLVKG
jgi:ABC-type transport system involved in cytochrome bd biosynthesis fused ATPase/permease subunit